MLLLPKFVGGFSGVVVDASSYEWFFIYAAGLGLPAVFMILLLMKQKTVA
jgi:PAT family beta-lactamase induction signal transducer AmpG